MAGKFRLFIYKTFLLIACSCMGTGKLDEWAPKFQKIISDLWGGKLVANMNDLMGNNFGGQLLLYIHVKLNIVKATE